MTARGDLDSLVAEWNGEDLVIRHDHPTGAWIVVAIHSTVLGPAAGGTRIKPYPGLVSALEDALRLSQGMTMKFATPGLPFGGGKAVIMVPSELTADARTGLLRRYGSLVCELGGRFYTGPDVGSTPEDMDVIAEQGRPYVFCRTRAAGGAGDPGPYTALGVLTGIQAVCSHLYGSNDLAGRRLLVQGAGDVGGALIPQLVEAGAEVAFSEVDADLIERFGGTLGLLHVDPDGVYDHECDVFVPCALGGIFDAETIPRLRCAAVAGSANNQLAEPEDADRLRRRGILYAPDYVVNVGGAMAMPGIEALGWSTSKAEAEVVSFVTRTLEQVFAVAESEGVTTDEAARRTADANLAAAS